MLRHQEVARTATGPALSRERMSQPIGSHHLKRMRATDVVAVGVEVINLEDR